MAANEIATAEANLDGEFLDVFDAQEVEVAIRSDGRVLWINIDGRCRIRVLRPKNIAIDDRRLTAQ